MALAEVEGYCGIEPDTELEMVAQQIAVIKLNRSGTEGLANQSYSGVSESYIDGYPAEIQKILNRKRIFFTLFSAKRFQQLETIRQKFR
jgi:hypothetical protein